MRVLSFILIGVILLVGSVEIANGCPVSDHCDGKRFHNMISNREMSFGEKLKYQTYMTPAWKDVEFELVHKSLTRPASGIGYVKIGQSTILIQTPDMNILTDPIWAGRAGPNSFSGPLRSRQPSVRFEDIPKIDVVLISHDHFDHLDLETLDALRTRFDPVILVGLGLKKFLLENGFARVFELDWWQSHRVRDVAFHFVPAQHSSGRGFYDRMKTLWGGFFIRTSQGSIYFSGDTGYGSHFKEIAEKLGSPFLSFLPIGGYHPRFAFISLNMNPKEAVIAHLDLGSRNSEAIHYETFKTSHENFGEPLQMLRTFATKYNAHTFRASVFGEIILMDNGTPVQKSSD